MGTWGTAIKSNDTSSDIYADFFELYNEGQEPAEISKKLIKDNTELINNPDDCNNLWFVLALAQWETKSLEQELYEKVKSIIESGQKALEGHKGRGIYSLFSGEHNKRIENVEKILAQLEKDEISSNNAFNQLALEGHWNQSSVLTWSYDSFNTKFISFLALTIPEKNIKKNFAPELFKDAEVKNNNIEKEYKAEI